MNSSTHTFLNKFTDLIVRQANPDSQETEQHCLPGDSHD